MTVKLSTAQAILLRTIVHTGPQFMSKSHVTSRWLVQEGFAEWDKSKLKATDKGRSFVNGDKA